MLNESGIWRVALLFSQPLSIPVLSSNVTVLWNCIYYFSLCNSIHIWTQGLHCCMRAFSSCNKQELLFVAVWGLLTAAASLAVRHRLQAQGLQESQCMGSVVAAHGLSSPSACGIFPDQVSNPCPLPLVGRFFSTLLAGKSYFRILDSVYRASPLFLFSPIKFLRAFLALSSVLMLFYFSLDFSLMSMFTTNSFIWLLSYCQILKLKNPEGKVREGKYFQKIVLK